jgi:diaminopimelate decarboxylase
MSPALDDAARPTIGGLDPEELVSEFGTPLYVYALDVVDRQVAALREILPPVFDLAYAVKANPSLGIVAHLGGLGLGADVASTGELATALRAGIDPAVVVFTGPGKRDDELEAAAKARIRAVTVESLGELDRLEGIAARLEIRAPVMLRIATPAQRPTNDATPDVRTGVAISGVDGGKFGIDPRELPEAARRAARSPHLRLLGLHAFGASNVIDADALADHVAWTVGEAVRMAVRLRSEDAKDVGLELVDIGGGLGIPYADGEPELELGRLGRALSGLASEWAKNEATRGMRVLLEPGRFLVAQAGTYLTRVVDRKTIGRRGVVIVDGGIHHLVRPALVGRQQRIVNLAPTTESSAGVMVAGPLCSGLDVLSDDVPINPTIGDLLGVLDTGAYGYTESMPLFLSHPTPAEVAVSAGRVGLLRPRIEPAAWLEKQHLPAWSPILAGASPRLPTSQQPDSPSDAAFAGPPPSAG